MLRPNVKYVELIAFDLRCAKRAFSRNTPSAQGLVPYAIAIGFEPHHDLLMRTITGR
jgi:hypothetical protein